MIGKLKGLVDSTGPDWAIVDVGGVGYVVHCSARTLGQLPEQGHPIALLIDTHLREDALLLYGFVGAAERDCFRLLQTVQGVGARVALAILSVLAPEACMQAIAAQDKAMLTRADGVGAKLAARIVNELKDKAAAWTLAGVATAAARGAPAAAPAGANGVAAEAVSALVNLGYGRSEAFGAVTAAERRLGEAARLESLIKEGLKELAR